ncbi:MAG: hypothetical protein ACEY3L_19495 [Wolbachia sp.]
MYHNVRTATKRVSFQCVTLESIIFSKTQNSLIPVSRTGMTPIYFRCSLSCHPSSLCLSFK